MRVTIAERKPADTGKGLVRVDLAFPIALPSKKNRLQPRRRRGSGRGLRYTDEVADAMNAAETLARAQWGPNKPAVHPEVWVSMHVANKAKDPDGIWTTLVDALVKAGVLFDDSIAWFNGGKHFEPVKIVPTHLERVDVTLVFRPEE